MTIDEILARHKLTRDDITNVSFRQVYDESGDRYHIAAMEWANPECDYALMSHEMADVWDEIQAMIDVKIIGYYPGNEPYRGGTYLLKRKASETITMQATMEYAFIEDNDGNITGAEYRNFRLESE